MKSRKRLLWHLYPSYVFITLVALLIVSLFTLSSLSDFFHTQIATDLQSRAYLFESGLRNLLISGQYDGVDHVCKTTGKKAFTRLTVILPSGAVVGDSEERPQAMDNHGDRPEVAAALTGKTGTTVRFSSTLNRNMIYVAIPVFDEDNIISVLRVSIPLSSFESETARIRTRIISAGIFIAVLAAGISLLVSRRITQPIEELTHGAVHFESGDLDYRLFIPESRELAELAEAMNQMAGQLDERIKTETRQKNKLEAVLAGMAEGVIAMDSDDHIISINDAAARFFRLDPLAATGKTLSEIVRNITFIDFVNASVLANEPREADIVLDDYGNRTLHTRTSSLLDGENRQAGTLIVFNDVTTLRRLETMRRDFAANVSHEIKTPLTSIRGFVETLLSDGDELNEKQVHFLQIIEKNVNRLMAIIEDLLKLSRIETEKPGDIHYSKANLYKTLDAAMTALKAEAEKKNIHLALSCDDKLMVRMDSSMIEQAVINLVDNAIKYCNENSRVDIRVILEKGGVDIHVADTGAGIEKEHLPRLFERFYRTDKARSRQLGGTGLGLAIVKHIMLAHKGDVSVTSILGKGSDFVLHLPVD